MTDEQQPAGDSPMDEQPTSPGLGSGTFADYQAVHDFSLKVQGIAFDALKEKGIIDPDDTSDESRDKQLVAAAALVEQSATVIGQIYAFHGHTLKMALEAAGVMQMGFLSHCILEYTQSRREVFQQQLMETALRTMPQPEGEPS